MFHTKLITDKLLRLFFFNIIWYHWVAVKMWAPAHSLTRSRAHIMRCVCVKYLLIHWLVSAAASSSSSVFFILFLYFSSQWHDVWAPMHAVLAERWIVVVNTMPSHYTQSCFRSSAQRFRGFFSIFFVTFSLSVSLSRLLFNVCCAFFSINVAQILHYMVTVAHYTHNHRVRFNNVCTAYTFEASHSSISKLFFFSRCSQLTLLLLLSSFSFQCVVVNSHIHFN